jgi:hypothetical protein
LPVAPEDISNVVCNLKLAFHAAQFSRMAACDIKARVLPAKPLPAVRFNIGATWHHFLNCGRHYSSYVGAASGTLFYGLSFALTLHLSNVKISAFYRAAMY